PVFLSYPITSATAGQAYSYQPLGFDKDGDSLTYVLVHAPAGMTVDLATGLVTWMPSTSSPGQATVVLQVYDTAGAYDTQSYTIHTGGVNRPPVFDPLPAQIPGKEGQLLVVPVLATDPEGDGLTYWADHL